MRKFLLTLGSVAAVAAPLTTVIACGDDHAHEDDHHGDDHHDHEHVNETAVGAALVALKEADLLTGTIPSASIIDQAALDTLIGDDHDLENVIVTLEVEAGHGTNGSLDTGDVLILEATPVEGYEFDSHQAHVVVEVTIGTGSEIVDGDHDHDHAHVDETAVGAALVALKEADLLTGTIPSASIIDQAALDTLITGIHDLEDVTVTLEVEAGHGTNGSLNTGDVLILEATPIDGHEFNNHEAHVVVEVTIGTGSAIVDGDHDHA